MGKSSSDLSNNVLNIEIKADHPSLTTSENSTSIISRPKTQKSDSIGQTKSRPINPPKTSTVPTASHGLVRKPSYLANFRTKMANNGGLTLPGSTDNKSNNITPMTPSQIKASQRKQSTTPQSPTAVALKYGTGASGRLTGGTAARKSESTESPSNRKLTSTSPSINSNKSEKVSPLLRTATRNSQKKSSEEVFSRLSTAKTTVAHRTSVPPSPTTASKSTAEVY